MRVLDLRVFPDITLNYFSTNSTRLRSFCRQNDISRGGEPVLIVSRTDRARILEWKEEDFIWVSMIEHDHHLSPVVNALVFCERRMQGNDRQYTRELRALFEKKIERQRRRDELAKERERERRGKRNGRH